MIQNFFTCELRGRVFSFHRNDVHHHDVHIHDVFRYDI